MEMTPKRWEQTGAYLREVFGREDAVLAGVAARAAAAGLPSIAVSGDVGRLLKILASMTNDGRGARVIVEVGALAGYSGTWLARGLGPGGRLITVEPEAAHAAVTRETFRLAGLADRTEVIEEPAPGCLHGLAARLGPGSVDVVFLDAIKADYPEYFRLLRGCIAVGGLLIADNALGSGAWWIDAPRGENRDRDGADDLNRMVAQDAAFEAACVPIREGVMIARRVA